MKTYTSIRLTDLPERLQAWLGHAGSFMQRLQAVGIADAHIRVLHESWQVPTVEEREILGGSGTDDMFIREVLIHSDEHALMFARTVIPRATLTGELQALAHLASQSLGSVLFALPDCKRSEFVFFPVEKDLWGRQSVFTLQNQSLLLSEIFLPEMMTL